jgi:Asp/Glu/hydantoin racemase
VKIFGREPALLSALAASAISLIGAFLVNLTGDQQIVLNAVVAAVFGLVTAIGVARDKLVPAILGLAQAALNTALAFGLTLDAPRQAIIMTLIANLVAAIIVRPQVTAKVPVDALDG